MGLGGLAGGGGGGGGLDVGGLVTGSVGGIVSGLGGLISGIAEKKEAARQRRRLRRAVRKAEGQTAAEVLGALNSPEFQASRQFIGGLFGLQPGQGAPGSQDRFGVFAGGQDVGGRTFFGTPGPGGLRPGTQRKGRTVGRRIARGITAQRRIEAGIARKPGKAAKRVARGEQALTRLSAERNLRTGAAGAIRARGLDLADVGELSPQGLQPIAPQAGGQAGGGLLNAQGFDPFTANVDVALQQALGQSGFETSLAGVASRALGTGLARTQLQMSLLPQLQGLATAGLNLRQQVLPQNLNMAQQFFAGGPPNINPFGQAALAGAAGFLGAGG